MRRLRLLFPTVIVGLMAACIAKTAAADGAHRFSEHLIADNYGYAYGVAAADLDGDGDPDLTSGDPRKNAMYWHENDGQGNFALHTIQKDEAGWFERHALGDVDGDGHLDVVVVKNLNGHIVWFRNSGTPGDGRPWERRVVSTRIARAYDVALADLNGDGAPDVAATAWIGNYIAWFANPGRAETNAEWIQYRVDENIEETRTIRTADFNGDGRPDLLGTARRGNLIAWYENTGQPTNGLWPRHVIDRQSPEPVHGQPFDMDKDGDADVVMAFGMLMLPGASNTHLVAWYENVGTPGKGMEWKKHVVGGLPYGFEAVAGDLDSDGDVDVAATGWGGAGCIMWFENPGDAKGEWTPHVLRAAWSKANQAIIEDLNADKLPDIAATAEGSANELRLWRNQGVPGK